MKTPTEQREREHGAVAVALVTGAGSGIGRASALAFADGGDFVVAADVDEAAGRETVSMIGHDRAMFVRADVADESDVIDLVRVAANHGLLRAVHNNAGVTLTNARLHELSARDWDSILGVNLRGVFLVLRETIRNARARDEAVAIVNTSSVLASSVTPGRSAYSASKAGVIMLTKAAAVENHGSLIRVNAVAPGTIRTPLVVNNPPADGLIGPQPSGRLGDPEEVAALVTWLCSPDASYINGSCVTIDGGWTTALPARSAT